MIQKIEKKRAHKNKQQHKHLIEMHNKRSEKLERWELNLKANRIDKLNEMRKSLIQKQDDIQQRIDDLKNDKVVEIM